jgi:hypothetical protein
MYTQEEEGWQNRYVQEKTVFHKFCCTSNKHKHFLARSGSGFPSNAIYISAWRWSQDRNM